LHLDTLFYSRKRRPRARPLPWDRSIFCCAARQASNTPGKSRRSANKKRMAWHGPRIRPPNSCSSGTLSGQQGRHQRPSAATPTRRIRHLLIRIHIAIDGGWSGARRSCFQLISRSTASARISPVELQFSSSVGSRQGIGVLVQQCICAASLRCKRSYAAGSPLLNSTPPSFSAPVCAPWSAAAVPTRWW
jgi:hypothetical protein